MLTFRRAQLFGLLVCISLLGFAKYLELYQSFIPCSLCLLQRWVFMIIGIFFLLGVIFTQNRIWRYVQSSLIVIFAFFGAGLAGRQLWWIHYFSHSVTSGCQADARYLLNHLPLHQAMLAIVQGGPECAQSHWAFLGLDIPSWSMLFFISFVCLGLRQIYRTQ